MSLKHLRYIQLQVGNRRKPNLIELHWEVDIKITALMPRYILDRRETLRFGQPDRLSRKLRSIRAIRSRIAWTHPYW